MKHADDLLRCSIPGQIAVRSTELQVTLDGPCNVCTYRPDLSTGSVVERRVLAVSQPGMLAGGASEGHPESLGRGRAGHGMDVFRVRDRLIDDYRDFTGSFVDIHDKNIRDHVVERMAQGYQWPDPWLSLNPNFASGGAITDLVTEGLLQPECERIFRLKDDNPDGPVLRLHQHQREAVEAARTGSSYVLTTGTGSGKSLAYIIPIVDRVLAARAAGTYRPGIKAIVVYPMNALANSQLRELEKFLKIGYPDGPPVTFERYTGQESAEDRARIIANPPDILLTNYVMLELVLTRPRDRGLIDAARGLWFLVRTSSS